MHKFLCGGFGLSRVANRRLGSEQFSHVLLGAEVGGEPPPRGYVRQGLVTSIMLSLVVEGRAAGT